MQRNNGALRAALLSVPPTLFYLVVAVGLVAVMPDDVFDLWQRGAFILGLFGLWRYGWQVIHLIRHWIYMRRVFPRLRAEADSHPHPWPGNLYVVVPSFREMPEVSEQVFRSIVRELSSLPCQVILVANVGSKEEMRLISGVVSSEPGGSRIELKLMLQHRGKRQAIGQALRTVARMANDPFRHSDSERDLCVLMDGDSLLGKGTFKKCIPFFASNPRLGALSTNNRALPLDVNTVLHDWYNLKFAQRHHVFASHSLSRRVLTLTGRCSMFRMSAIMNEEFIDTVENDHVEHWLFGRIPFLMGDDKSTWYMLLRKGWEMLYVPDAMVWAIEERNGYFFPTSVSLMHRWFGNMLRTNGRALAVGPKPMGFFIWWCILDQRFTVWTPLVGPISAILLAMANTPYFILFYVIWAIITRLTMLWFYVLEGSPMQILHLPLMLYNQWWGSIIKIRCLHNLARQHWSKGAPQRDTGIEGGWRKAAHLLMTLNILFFILILSLVSGALPISLHGFGRGQGLAPVRLAQASAPEEQAVTLGGIASGQDISTALQQALDTPTAAQSLRIALPEGSFRLDAQVRITRSNVRITGAGPGRTRLVSSVRADPATKENALLFVRGNRGPLQAPLAEPVNAGTRTLPIADWPEKARFIWLSAPNTEYFFDAIGDTAWRKQKPRLRQRCYKVLDSNASHVFLADPLDIDLPAGTEVSAPRMVANVRLSGFSLEQKVPGKTAPSPQDYGNAAPEYAVDGIRFQWACDCSVRDVAILNAGRHPLDFDRALDCSASRLTIDGAWNKGPGGNGYVRFARAFNCRLSDSKISRIRHLAFQWSSAGNTVTGCSIGTDINFHGGFSSRNTVRDSILNPPSWHKWGKETRMPAGGAHWAAPDGPDNRILN